MTPTFASLGAAFIVAIVFGSLLLGLTIISWTVVRLSGGKSGRGSENESQLIQELYQGINRMEQRVEALETLLLERDQKGSGK